MPTTPEPTKPVKPISDEMKKRIDIIAAIQTKLGLSDPDFCKASPGSATTLYRLKNGTYSGDVRKYVEMFAEHAKQLEKDYNEASKRAQFAFHKTLDFERLSSAVDEASANAQMGMEDKLVMFVARTGWGKTTNAKKLMEHRPGALFTASPDWRRSYKYALQQIAKALGVSGYGSRRMNSSADNLEGAIFAHLQDRPQTLYFQELGPFTVSARVLEFLKGIINVTPCVVVMFVVPEFYGQLFSQCGETAQQLATRTVALVRAQELSAGFVAKFFVDQFGRFEGLEDCAKILTERANKDRGLHMVTRVIRMLADELAPSGKTPATSDILKKVAVYEASKQRAA